MPALRAATAPIRWRCRSTPPPEWPDGAPDLVLTVPPYQVPATGVVDYLYPGVPTGLTSDTWVRRVVVLPTSEAVTHHVLAFLEPFDDRRPAGLTADDWVGVYSPGVDLVHGRHRRLEPRRRRVAAAGQLHGVSAGALHHGRQTGRQHGPARHLLPQGHARSTGFAPWAFRRICGFHRARPIIRRRPATR